MPGSRRYCRIEDPQHAAFLKPEAIWMTQHGHGAPVAAPKATIAAPRLITPLYCGGDDNTAPTQATDKPQTHHRQIIDHRLVQSWMTSLSQS